MRLRHLWRAGLDHAPELHASPHVEHSAGFIRHPARIPRRIPHDVDLDLADARHAGHRVLHHDRQLLRGGTVGRGERHVDGHRAFVGDIDLVDQADLKTLRPKSELDVCAAQPRTPSSEREKVYSRLAANRSGLVDNQIRTISSGTAVDDAARILSLWIDCGELFRAPSRPAVFPQERSKVFPCFAFAPSVL